MMSAGVEKGADFLSLDVEGAEELVIKTVDPAKFRIILVELDQHDPAKNERVSEFLISAGLRRSRSKNRIAGGSVAFFNSGVAMHEGMREWGWLDARLQNMSTGDQALRAHMPAAHRDFMFERALRAALRVKPLRPSRDVLPLHPRGAAATSRTLRARGPATQGAVTEAPASPHERLPLPPGAGAL
eukprot:6033600-Prymnesium_polylepis.1